MGSEETAQAAGGPPDDRPHEACLNCGTGLVGAYCHGCGQPAHVHRSLHAFLHDLLHAVLHVEGKILRTLPMLVFRPGQLTRRYIAGERARFVSPMALFLFSVFLMFAVFSWIGGPFVNEFAPVVMEEPAREQMRGELAAAQARADAARAELGRARQAGEPTAALEARVRALDAEAGTLRQAVNVAEVVTASPGDRPGNQRLDIELGWPPLDHAIEKAQENPSLLIYKLQSNAYKFSWALIPLSVPFVWLVLFWKRRYGLYDHTVFVTYSIAFMSLGLVALSLLRPLGPGGDVQTAALLLVPPLHIYAQLKGAYLLSRRGALWRTGFLLVGAFVAGMAFLVFLLALGAL